MVGNKLVKCPEICLITWFFFFTLISELKILDIFVYIFLCQDKFASYDEV